MSLNLPKRAYCWTSFSEAEPKFSDEKFTYMIYQPEVCPDTGRKHWQGFVICKSPMRFTQIKSLIGDPALHLAEIRGSHDQNIAYCSKEESRAPGGKVTEYGKAPRGGQGTRNDIDTYVALVKGGATVADVIDKHPAALRYYGALDRYRSARIGKSRFNPDRKVIMLSGPSGCGKTRLAHHIAGGEVMRVAQWDKDKCWFDGCDNERVVLVDDLDPRNCPKLSEFKQVLDGYSMKMPCKGGFVYFDPDLIIITSNYPLDYFYRDELNFDIITKLPLEGAALKKSREPINRRIQYHDCWKTPPTQLDFYLENQHAQSQSDSGDSWFSVQNDEGHLTDPE